MEPLTASAIAIGTAIALKALEKTGEKVAESLWDKTGQFLFTLKKHSPGTVTAIEKVAEQPLDYGKAILEVESAAKANPEVNQAVEEVAAEARANPQFAAIQEVMEKVKTQHRNIIKGMNIKNANPNISNNTFNFGSK